MWEWLLKYPPSLLEQGRLVWAPLIDVSWLWTAGAGLLLLLVASLVVPVRMRALGPVRLLCLGALQAAFVAGVLVLLARPTLEITTLTPGASAVAVLLDTSRSMDFPAAQGDGSRLEEARSLLGERLLPELEGLAEVATFTFDEGLRRGGEEALSRERGDRTHLLAALDDVLGRFRGTPLAAVVVVTDGGDNGAARDVAALGGAGVPVHTVGVGAEDLPGETRITDVALNDQAPPDSRVVARVTLRHGTAGPAVIRVRDGERLIARQDVVLEPGASAQQVDVSFDTGPGGIHELSFEVEPPPGDTLAGNNRLGRLLTVREQRHRVLYLEGEPRWEYKFIRRALSGDELLELTTWLRTTARKTYRQNVGSAEELAMGFPETLEALYAYDVIVLGSLAATYLSEVQRGWLESFVGERGGSLLALAGRESLGDGGWDVTPLADALPVQITRGASPTYRVQEGLARPSRAGLTSRMIRLQHSEGGDPWVSLPPLADHQRLGALKPAATVLLELTTAAGDAWPLLVTQPYGQGTAAVLASATTWRWQMRTPAGDERHRLFWRQLVRQLGVSAPRRREVDAWHRDDRLIVQVTERDAAFRPRLDVAGSVRVMGPGLPAAEVPLAAGDSPGQLAASLPAPTDGIYRLDVHLEDADVPLTRFVQLGGQSLEHREPAQDVAVLRRIASVTGGRYWSPATVAGLPESLRLASAGIRHREHLALWDMPLLFAVLLLVKAAEWLLRRRWGRI